MRFRAADPGRTAGTLVRRSSFQICAAAQRSVHPRSGLRPMVADGADLGTRSDRKPAASVRAARAAVARGHLAARGLTSHRHAASDAAHRLRGSTERRALTSLAGGIHQAACCAPKAPFTPDGVELQGSAVIFRAAPSKVQDWLRWIDRWVGNSVVEE
jgi:hypothetical protein